MRKVNELLREVIAEEVTLLKDPRIGFLTITGVDTSPDLRRATVFYSVLGDDEVKESTAVALEYAAPRLQGRLAGQVRLKFTPRLSFEVDPAIDTGLRMGKILHEIDQERTDQDPADPAADPVDPADSVDPAGTVADPADAAGPADPEGS